MIAQETINAVNEKSDLLEVISDFLSLKKRGTVYVAPCPFHSEKSASFTVSPSKQVFKCFGCGKNGKNAVSFVMQMDNSTYPEAVKYLAGKYGIEFQETEQNDRQKEIMLESESLFNINKVTANFFQVSLQESDTAKSYFESRGLSEATIMKFQIGYAKTGYRDLYDYLITTCSYSEELVLKADLALKKEGRAFDKFRDRIIFPIHTVTGKIVGFGGRVMPNAPGNLAKYTNTAETTIYQKREQLYGIWFARKSIIDQDNCLLVEGYMDVCSVSQGGIENVVASSGTSLTTEQLKTIKRLTDNLTFLFDGDAAGIKAAVRGMEGAIKEGFNVKLVRFPKDHDPDSFIKEFGAGKTRKYIEENRFDMVDFMLSELDQLEAADKDKELDKLIALINIIPEDKVFARIEAIKKVAKVTGAAEDLINHKVTRQQAKAKPAALNAAPLAPEEITEKPKHVTVPQEMKFVEALIEHGSKTWYGLHVVCELMIKNIGIPAENFHDPVAREVYQTYLQYIEEHQTYPDDSFFKEQQDSAISDLYIDLSLRSEIQISEAWFKEVKREEPNYLQEVNSIVYDLQLLKLREARHAAQQDLMTATDPEKINSIMQLLKLITEKIHEVSQQMKTNAI